MRGKGIYKFKVINGVLSWKNDEMEKFMPVSAEILTRVILLYEKELKHGIKIWKEIENKNSATAPNSESPLFEELADWMEQLQSIFSDTDPFREKEKWRGDYLHLN